MSALGKAFAECPIKNTRQRPFAGQNFAVCSLPSVALGKGFAECIWAFAECFWHSAKRLSPVVISHKTISIYFIIYLFL